MCINPMYLPSRDGQPIPCGKCPKCKMRLVHGWAFRLMQEEKKAISSHFITLTYATENVPITKRRRLTLWKRDCQLFCKRLRKAHTKSAKTPAIKYFAVGEYGGTTNRPHYHFILFNADIQKIQNAWGLGHVHYGTVDSASVYYCLKYVMKPARKNKKDDRQKEFRLMSKGLGLSYVLDKRFQNWHKKDIEGRTYLNLMDGKKIGMPRYYKDKIYSEEERERVAFQGLLTCRGLAEKDTRTHEQKGQAILAAYFHMEFEARLRCKV